MIKLKNFTTSRKLATIAAICCITVLFLGIVFVRQAQAQSAEPASGEHLLSVYDDGTERGLLTRASTLREAFREAGIAIDPNDRVEPALDQKLVASNYEVNIYRAQPVTIIDGQARIKVMSPYRTAKQIAEQAGMTLQDEDIVKMNATSDVAAQGIGVHLTITRATEFTLMLYGKKTTAYTQGKTVAEMLKEKNITLGADDTISVSQDSPLKAGMIIEIWRNGVQTVTEEQAIPFGTQRILDMDRKIGYHEIKTTGKPGMRLVTYEVVMQDGKEIGRKQIQSVVSSEPQSQVEIIGNQPVNPLTKSKGAQHFVDSKGVTHRETYYDLPMGGTMGRCGGTYSVRADGAKVDQDGYILVAANLGRYPSCSIVETSMGLGRVYDTGGFALVHPDGFDLATDWTNNDGR